MNFATKINEKNQEYVDLLRKIDTEKKGKQQELNKVEKEIRSAENDIKAIDVKLEEDKRAVPESITSSQYDDQIKNLKTEYKDRKIRELEEERDKEIEKCDTSLDTDIRELDEELKEKIKTINAEAEAARQAKIDANKKLIEAKSREKDTCAESIESELKVLRRELTDSLLSTTSGELNSSVSDQDEKIKTLISEYYKLVNDIQEIESDNSDISDCSSEITKATNECEKKKEYKRTECSNKKERIKKEYNKKIKEKKEDNMFSQGTLDAINKIRQEKKAEEDKNNQAREGQIKKLETKANEEKTAKSEEIKKLEAEKETIQGELKALENPAELSYFLKQAKEELDSLLANSEYEIGKKDFSTASQLPEKICIGKRVNTASIKSCALMKKLYGDRKIGNASPVVLDMRNIGNVIINASQNDRTNDSLYRVVCGLIMKYLEEFPIGSLKVHVFDEDQTHAYFNKMKNQLGDEILNRCRDDEFGHIVTSVQDSSEAVASKLVGEVEDIYDFYPTDQSGIAKVNLVVIRNNFSKKPAITNNWGTIKTLMQAGNRKNGVRFIIVNDYEQTETSRTYGINASSNASLLDEMKKLAQVFDFKNDKIYFGNDEINMISIPSENGEGFIETRCNKYKKALDDLKRISKVSYEDIGFGQQMVTGDYSSAITIPVGKCGSDVYELTFNCGGGNEDTASNVHYMIIGKSGSGKSSLFHSVIINGAMKYSPKDLRFWLLDFKSGGASSYYISSEQQPLIPHIERMALNNDAEDALYLFSILRDEMKRRQNLFQTDGNEYRRNPFNELHNYNKYMDENDHSEKHLPRIILLVDEANNLFGAEYQSLKDIIKNIAEQGRSTGIHVVLVAQNCDDYARHLREAFINQVGGKISFKIDEESLSGAFDATFCNSAKSFGITNFPNGRCVAMLGDSINIVQMAYCNMDNKAEKDKYFSQIRNQYGNIKTKLYFVGDTSRLKPDSLVVTEDNGTKYQDLVNSPYVSQDESSYRIAYGENYYSKAPQYIELNSKHEGVSIIGEDSEVAGSICSTILKSLQRIDDKEIYVCNGFDRNNIFTKTVRNFAQQGTITEYAKGQIGDLLSTLNEIYNERKDTSDSLTSTDEAPVFSPVFAIVSNVAPINPPMSPIYSDGSNIDSDGSNIYSDGSNYGIFFIFSTNEKIINSNRLMQDLVNNANEVIAVTTLTTQWIDTLGGVSRPRLPDDLPETMVIHLANGKMSKIRPILDEPILDE